MMKKLLLSVVCLALTGVFTISCSDKHANIVQFSLYGTDLNIHFDTSQREAMKDVSKDEVSKCLVWIKASTIETLKDCQRIKQELNLSDWAYVKMLDRFATASLDSTNEAVLLMYDMLTRSGYGAMVSANKGKLNLWYQSDAFVYNAAGILLNGHKYYVYGDSVANEETAMLQKMEGRPIDFHYQGEMKLAQKPTAPRTITSKKDSTFAFTITMNQNLIDYYNEVPLAGDDENFMTRWATLAEYPFEQQVKDSLVTKMKQKVAGMSQLEAVQQILWWVQTGFEFEYDEKVWGYDRAFYPEETLFYPYADSEDRSILLARLVRDVVGIDVVLIYYSTDHLAAAVDFTDAVVVGDFLKLEDRRFIICDPSYIGGHVGETMPTMKDSETTLIQVK